MDCRRKLVVVSGQLKMEIRRERFRRRGSEVRLERVDGFGNLLGQYEKLCGPVESCRSVRRYADANLVRAQLFCEDARVP